MPRLIGKLHRKYAGPEAKKNGDLVHAQRRVLTQVAKKASQEGPANTAVQSTFGRLAHCGIHQQYYDRTFKPKDKADRPYVVVIGAGLAGLSSAYELAVSGQYNVVILEANSRVGGRVWSVKQNDFENTITSTSHKYTTVERGGELVGLNHFMWLHYADLFGLHLDYLEPPSTAEDEPDAPLVTAYEYLKLIYGELDDAASKLDVFTKHQEKAPWDTEDAKRLDSISLEAFLDELTAKYSKITLAEVKAKGFALNEFKFDEFKKAMNATKSDFENNNGLPCAEQSLYFNLVTIGNGNRNLDPNLLKSVFDNIDGIEQAEQARKLSFWEDAELFRCREGNMGLAVAFHENLLKAGAEIQLNTTVTELVFKQDHVKITTNHGPLKLPGKKVSRVVLATPPSVWKQLTFSPALPPALQPKLGYLVKYLFEVTPEMLAQFRKLDGSDHTSWAMVWEAAKNEVVPGIEPEHTLAAFAGGASAFVLANPPNSETLGADKARIVYLCDNLNKMRPKDMTYTFTPNHIVQSVFMDWPKTQFVQAGYSCPTLNEVVTLGPIIHNPINERLHLAGEYACRYQWCGFMEGALLSGAGVAQDILSRGEDDTSRARVQKPPQAKK